MDLAWLELALLLIQVYFFLDPGRSRLPRLSNVTDVDPLAAEPGVIVTLATEAAHLMFLQDAQQLHLRREGDVTDLVEQDRAALGRLEDAWPIEHRAGKRAARVSE